MRSRKAFGPPIQMAAGLLLFGLAGYVFVALTGRTLTQAEANLAIAFYFLVNIVGPGIFYALEQVTSRSTSRALAAGVDLDPEFRRTSRAGAGLVVAVTGLLLLLSPVMVGATLHGDWLVFAGVLAAPVIAGALHFVRGQLGGMRRFGRYAATLAVEGTVRLLLCLVLALAGTPAAWIYGVAYLAASVVAAAVGMAWARAGPSRVVTDRDVNKPLAPAALEASLGKGLAALAVATLFAQLLPNIAPLVVTSRSPQDSAIALAFGQAAVVARIPLLLFFPIQTMLLPGLTAAVTQGNIRLVARRITVTLAAITGLGMIGALIFVVLGPWALRTFLHTTAELSAPVMLLLAVSTVVLIAAFAVQPALVALARDHVVTVGWALGSAVTIAVALLPADPVGTAAIGQVVGPALTVVVVLLGLRAGLRLPTPRSPRSADVIS
jgi:O-antigen/teichoic acid export membrane protein